MSSYFDTMGRCARDKKALFELVKRQYYWYLGQLNRDTRTDVDLEKVSTFMAELERIKLDERIGLDYAVECAIQEIHSLAHRVGSAGIRFKGNRRASDNPSIPY